MGSFRPKYRPGSALARILEVVKKRGNSGITASEAANWIGVGKSSATGAMHRLKVDGWIKESEKRGISPDTGMLVMQYEYAGE